MLGGNRGLGGKTTVQGQAECVAEPDRALSPLWLAQVPCLEQRGKFPNPSAGRDAATHASLWASLMTAQVGAASR